MLFSSIFRTVGLQRSPVRTSGAHQRQEAHGTLQAKAVHLENIKDFEGEKWLRETAGVVSFGCYTGDDFESCEGQPPFWARGTAVKAGQSCYATPQT